MTTTPMEGEWQKASTEHERFQQELAALLNRYSTENASNTPDFILAKFLLNCLTSLNVATRQRDKWYGIHPQPGLPTEKDPQ